MDIGCGLGLGLACANRLDGELLTTEFDTGALAFVSEHFPVKTFQGDVWDANYPDNYFDFIHISHVLDPKAYIL